MSEELSIRAVMRDDLTAVADLEARSFPSPWKKEFFVAEIDSIGRYNIVVVTRDGGLIGYVFAMFYADEMHINKIAVEPSWRRRGVARLLMDECFEFARINGLVTMTLEVRESNEPARQLYRNLGFEDGYRRSAYYPDGEAALVMTRKFEPSPEVA